MLIVTLKNIVHFYPRLSRLKRHNEKHRRTGTGAGSYCFFSVIAIVVAGAASSLTFLHHSLLAATFVNHPLLPYLVYSSFSSSAIVHSEEGWQHKPWSGKLGSDSSSQMHEFIIKSPTPDAALSSSLPLVVFLSSLWYLSFFLLVFPLSAQKNFV